jgi:murein DD-endopeptidase MepM/ murein hydrolase activator NlpD
MTRPALFGFALLACALGLLGYVVLRPTGGGAVAASTCCEPGGLETQPIHRVRERAGGNGSVYAVENLVAGPIEARCTLGDADNVQAVPALPRQLVVPASGQREVAELRVVDPARSASASVACEAIVGDPRARPAASHSYAFPLPAGTEYTLDQGFGGRFSHDGDETRHSLDFGVPEGTPVLAARNGVVMQVEDDFRARGTDPKRFGDRANYVRVLHEDGSMAVYAHLAPASLLRRPGDRVVVGQLIGKSGNTGYSTGPHLHFSVQRNVGMALHSIPFTVIGVDTREAGR